MQNDYPFVLTIVANDSTVEADDSGSLTITFSWAYESGDDDTDTDYGIDAYEFYEDNPTEDAIELIIKLIVTQHNEQAATS